MEGGREGVEREERAQRWRANAVCQVDVQQPNTHIRIGMRTDRERDDTSDSRNNLENNARNKLQHNARDNLQHNTQRSVVYCCQNVFSS